MQQQVGTLAAMQQLEDRTDEQLQSESKHRAAARALLGARAAERYDAQTARSTSTRRWPAPTRRSGRTCAR